MPMRVKPYCPPQPATSGGVESPSGTIYDPTIPWHPPGQMFPGRRADTRGGLGCCNTLPKNEWADEYSGSGAGVTPPIPGAASGLDLSALPDWVKYAAIAVGIYLLVKK